MFVKAEDKESMYADGATEMASSVQGEKRLIMSMICRAVIDIKTYTASKVTTAAVRDVATEAHSWIHDTTADDIPFSFVWCCNEIYPTCADGVIVKLRMLTELTNLETYIKKLRKAKCTGRVRLS